MGLRRPRRGPHGSRRGSSRGARTRERIVAEALRLFEQQGYRATSVESIARAAGTSRATLYQYFESKEQIFVELIDECGSALRRVARRIGVAAPTPANRDRRLQPACRRARGAES